MFGCFIIGMLEAGLVASGLTGEWVRTVQGVVFLAAVIFYLYMEEPQRRRALAQRFRLLKPAADEAARPAAAPAPGPEGAEAPQRQGR